MSQTIRQQIAQKQAELAELERQALLVEKTEQYKTFAQTADSNPDFLKIYLHAQYIKTDMTYWAEQHPDFVSQDLNRFLKDIYPNVQHDYLYNQYNPFTETMITDVFDMIIETETDEYWIESFRKVCAKYIEKVYDPKNTPPQPPPSPIVPDFSKKGIVRKINKNLGK